MADETLNNLALWNSVQTTDPTYTKDFKRPGGFAGTSVNATYLVRRATETFGPCGIGWGYQIDDEQYREAPNGFVIHVVKLNLWYKHKGETGYVTHFGQTTFVGVNSKGSFVDEEAPKKSLTDALTKCLSMLGFAGDIHLGLYDDNKYIAEIKQQFVDAPRAVFPAGADRIEVMNAAEAHGSVETDDGIVTGADSVRRRVESSTAGRRIRECKTLEHLKDLVESKAYKAYLERISPESADALLALQREHWELLFNQELSLPEDQEALIAEIGDRYAETRTLVELDDVTEDYGERVDGLSTANRERIVDLHGKNQRRILAAAADADIASTPPAMGIPDEHGAFQELVRQPSPPVAYTELKFPTEDSYRAFINAQISAVRHTIDAERLKTIWNATKPQRVALGLVPAKTREMQMLVADILKLYGVASRVSQAQQPTQH